MAFEWVVTTVLFSACMYLLIMVFYFKTLLRKEKRSNIVVKQTLNDAEVVIRKYQVQLQRSLGNIDISSDARKYGSNPEIQQNLIAQAVLVNSLATRIAGNFYIRFNKPPKPTRIFTNPEDAKSWLLYKKKEFEAMQKEMLNKV